MPKRHWHRPLVWILPACTVLALLVNGPLFRWGAEFGILKVLAKQQITGPFEVDGSAWSGPQLSHVDWTSAKDGTRIKAAHAQVYYEPLRWFREGLHGILRSVELHQAEATIDLTQPQPKSTEATNTGPPKPLPLRQLPQPNIDLQDVTVTFLLPEQRQVVIDKLNVNIAPNHPGTISIEAIQLPDGPNLTLDAKLRYTQTGFCIDDCGLLPGIAIEHWELGVTEDRHLQSFATIQAYGGTLESTLSAGQEHLSLNLTEGAIDLSQVLPESPWQGNLTKFSTVIDRLQHPWHQRQASAKATIESFAFNEIRLEHAEVNATQGLQDWQATAEIQLDPNNAFTLRGHTTAPTSGTIDWNAVNTFITFDANLNDASAWMKQCRWPVQLDKLTGSMNASFDGGQLRSLDGKLQVGSLHKTPWKTPAFTLAANTDNQALPMNIILTSDRFLKADTRWDTTFSNYQGSFTADIRNLTALQDHTLPNPLQGAVRAHWEGNGVMINNAHHGSLSLKTNNLGPSDSTLIYESSAAVDYSPEGITIPSLKLAMNELRLALAATLNETGLSIPQLTLHQRDSEWLSGTISIPLTNADSLANRFWNAEAPVAIDLQSIDMPLTDLAQMAGQEQPHLAGTIRLNSSIQGPPKALQARIALTGRQLGMAAASPFPSGGGFDLELTTGAGRALLKGELRHPHLEPIEMLAEVPFQPQSIADAAQAPLVAFLKVPATDLGIVKDYAPTVRELTGTLAADIHIVGTIKKPEILGEIILEVPHVRFASINQFELTDTKVIIQGQPNILTITEAHTHFADGRVDLSGTVELSEPANPVLALNLTAAQAPLARNESMIVRSNANINLSGPLAQATIKGHISLVESRYFQEIDVLPTNRPTTSVPSSPFAIEKFYGIDAPPFKDWSIDLTLRTDEPFRVRTNLAAADIVTNLHLTGTGERIVPNGSISLTDAYARLPFSRLDLARSAIHFNEQTGFLGALDVRGESKLRDYRTRIAVKGNLNEVEAVLTSSPPMPDEEIMALLATGSTREELVGNSEVAASRAALLLFDKLWRRIAKKDWEDPSAMREKRLTFESGQVNPRTGRTMTTARLRLTDHFSITGDADIQGNFRGLLQYLFRF